MPNTSRNLTNATATRKSVSFTSLQLAVCSVRLQRRCIQKFGFERLIHWSKTSLPIHFIYLDVAPRWQNNVSLTIFYKLAKKKSNKLLGSSKMSVCSKAADLRFDSISWLKTGKKGFHSGRLTMTVILVLHRKNKKVKGETGGQFISHFMCRTAVEKGIMAILALIHYKWPGLLSLVQISGAKLYRSIKSWDLTGSL